MNESSSIDGPMDIRYKVAEAATRVQPTRKYFEYSIDFKQNQLPTKMSAAFF